MMIKILSLIGVADERGPEMDQGSMIRYLNEIMWFPTAALEEYIQWEPVDEKFARAVMQYKGISASAIFYFNEDGELVNFIAERYMKKNDKFEKEMWSTPITGHQEFHGIHIPTEGEAVWKLEGGDFSYI